MARIYEPSLSCVLRPFVTQGYQLFGSLVYVEEAGLVVDHSLWQSPTT